MKESDLHCPECGNNVSKAGKAWSGRRSYQQYRCPICRRSTIRPLDNQGNRVEAKPYNKETHIELPN